MNLFYKILLIFCFLLFQNLHSQNNKIISYDDYDSIKAQEISEYNLRYILFADYTMNFHDVNFSIMPLYLSSFEDFENGYGNGINFGGGVQFRYNKDWYYGGKLIFGNLNGRMEQIEYRKITLHGELTEAKLRNYFNTAINTLSISPFLSYSISQVTERLYTTAGFTFGVNIKSNYTQYEELLSPNYGTFDNGTRITNNVTAELPDQSLFLFAVNLGISFEIPLSSKKNIKLIPTVNYSHWFISPVKNLNWKVNQITIGTGINYNAPPIPQPPPVDPILPPLLPLQIPKLNTIFTVEADYITTVRDSINGLQTTNNLVVEEFAQSNMKPMLNYLFFDENLAEIPWRYELSNEPKEKFDYKITQRLNALETYYYLLDIVGDRMKQYPNATITLTGTNCNKGEEKGNIKLSQARANVVKEYLVDIWNIEEYRIKTDARNLPKESTSPLKGSGDDENRRVEIYSSDERITEPIMSFDTINILKNNDITFNTIITSTFDISENKLFITSGNKIVKEWNLSNRNKDTIVWNLEELKLDFDFTNSLQYQVVTKNKINDIATSEIKQIVTDKITVKAKRSVYQGNDKEYEYYSLILFDFASRNLAVKHNKVIDFIKTRIKPASTVIVNGYTDIIGQKEANKRIALERAESAVKRLKVKNILGVSNIQINGIGNDELLYDNRYPEGRFYCRTVTITIETPVNNE